MDGALDCAVLLVRQQWPGKDSKEGAELVPGLVVKLKKALTGRPSSRQRAGDVLLELMEVGPRTMESCVLALLEAVKCDKNPKVQQCCASVARDAVAAFGAIKLPVQPLLQLVAAAVEVKAPLVRKEATLLACEANAWFQGAFKDLVGTSVESPATQKTLSVRLRWTR
jgi:hypothetical protein